MNRNPNHRKIVCPRIYRPIIIDGILYNNSCEARRSSRMIGSGGLDSLGKEIGMEVGKSLLKGDIYKAGPGVVEALMKYGVSKMIEHGMKKLQLATTEEFGKVAVKLFGQPTIDAYNSGLNRANDKMKKEMEYFKDTISNFNISK